MTTKFNIAIATALLVSVIDVGAAKAFDPLPNLVNLNFNQVEHSPKGSFGYVNPTGWTGGGGLIFVDSTTIPGADAAGPVYLTTYGDPVGSVTGNYVEADGNPDYEGSFSHVVDGLTPGKTYTLSFYQGASQQLGFGTGLPTTNQWIVSLADVGLSIGPGGPLDPTYGPTDVYYSTDPNASIAASQLMVVPSGGTVGFNFVSVNLTAHAPSELLSFLAWGDNGSTINLPPIAFLAGVDSPPGLGAPTPEPATWALMITGLMGIGGLVRRRRAGVLATV